jgi:ABC-type polysaccharide/polyol phosphate export permease
VTSVDIAGREPVYDSARRLGPWALLREAWQYREVTALLARRELTGRYRQALLGAWWTVLPPLAYAGALWAVFSQLAPFSTEGVPYVVYVLSGVVVLTFVAQGLLAVANAVVTNAVVLRRTFVPVGVFAAASAAAASASLAITTVALLVVQVATGKGIPWTVVLLPLLFVLLVIAIGGTGLLVGSVGAVLVDAIEFMRIVLQIVAFLVPVFYPLSVVPPRYRFLIEANPIYHFVVVFRDLAYGGSISSWWSVLVCAGVAAGSIAAGILGFTRMRRALPSVL